MSELPPEDSTPLHIISDDGLTLTTYAWINGLDYKIEISWESIELAKENYEIAKFNHEERIYLTRSESEIDGSKVGVKFHNIFGFKFRTGYMFHANYDKWNLSLGKRKLIADIVDGKTKLSTLHWEHSKSNQYRLFGIGGKRNAVYIAFGGMK